MKMIFAFLEVAFPNLNTTTLIGCLTLLTILDLDIIHNFRYDKYSMVYNSIDSHWHGI